jgi:hypothetical protein
MHVVRIVAARYLWTIAAVALLAAAIAIGR